MQPIIKFVMTHLISLLCGLAALVFLIVGVMGMTSTSVQEAMRKRLQETGASEIPGLRGRAKNQAMIDAEQEKGRRFEAEFEETKAVLEKINKRTPIMEGVFPPPTTMTPEAQVMPFRFRERYNEVLDKLPGPLLGGTLPDRADIQEEEENVKDLLLQEQEQLPENAARSDGAQKPPTGSTVLRPTFPLRGSQQQRAAASTPGAQPKYDPVLRANVTKAKNIRCYYDATTFHRSPVAIESSAAPTADEMWKAQVGLWIQQDVVSAVSKLNAQAAEQVKDGDAFVENVPVKHLMEMRVVGYVKTNDIERFESIDPGSGASAAVSFTGRQGDELFDVLRFTVRLVCDQRDMLRVVDAICRENFYTCIGLNHAVPPPDLAARGYLYGTAPVVMVDLTFEGYMARSIYDPLMPPTFRARLSGQSQP